MRALICVSLLGVAIVFFSFSQEAPKAVAAEWKKHIITEKQTVIVSIAPADYNQDGKVDVISSFHGKAILYKAPNWEPEVIYNFPDKKLKAISCTSLDIDQDGDLDWVGGGAKGGVIWLENPGEEGKQWTARNVDSRINGLHHVMTADVNNDGKLDLLANNFTPNGELGDCSMWYETPTYPKQADQWICNIFAHKDAQGGSHYFGFGDIDNDGWNEIALGAKGKPFKNGNWFAYWKNPGKLEITRPWKKSVLLENETGATNVRIHDVNGDGKNDFIMSNGHGVGIFWLEAPSWTRHMIDPEMVSPHSLTSVDYDSDGDIDVASCGFGSQRVSVYYNDGKGNFQRRDIDLKQQSYDLQSIDMDGDGDLDLINAGRGSKNITWYENPHHSTPHLKKDK